MRLLQVIHDFLPSHQAGSELYCYHLSRELQRMGHEVVLFFGEIDHERANYSTRRGTFNGLPFLEIVNNHAYRAFEETYNNPHVEKVFAAFLDEFEPDVVHFHHLLGLSFGCVRLCNERSIPVVFTLHDYWLTCSRGGGQRFRGEGKVCLDVDPNLCAECVSRFVFPSGRLGRIVKRLFVSIDRPGEPTLLPVMKAGRIETPDARFVSLGRCDIDGDCRDVLFAHPPASISFRCTVQADSSLVFAVAMAPDTYERPGDGVRFSIACDGETIYERILQPKQDNDDRRWKNERIPLGDWGGKKRRFVFRTEAYPHGNVDFCAACWAEPKLIQAQGRAYRPTALSRFQSLVEGAAGALHHRGLLKQVERRVSAAREVFNGVGLFVAPSPFLREKYIQFGLDPDKIVFSDYGIAPLGELPPPREPKRPVRFTYVGTLAEHKGLHVLVEAFNRLPDEAAILNVYGDPSEFTGYVGRIQSGIAHPGIRVRGRAENREIPGILSNSDVLVVPSIWFENSPITIHEAFLARVPVITSRFGGMADLVRDGRNGLLFELGNADDLYRCLRRCVDAPERIEAMRPDPTEVKTIEADAEWTVEQYQRLLGRS